MSVKHTVTILGTGDFGRALAKPLLQAGYSVTFGSRHPEKRDLSARDPALAGAKLCSIEEAITASNIVFLALHTSAQQQLHIFQQQLAGKVLVDVSNVPKVDSHQSNAEKLQQMFPQSQVVKAFNTLSAYTLMTGYSTANLDVHIAGDDEDSVQTVLEVARRMGFNAVVWGNLQMAREMEASNAKLFTGWGTPLIVAAVTQAVWLGYAIINSHILKGTDWSRLPMNTTGKCLGCASITLLTFCYLPGCIAAFTQLINGTKHKPFSSFLDRWLKMRKQLGLIALWLAVAHCIISLPQINPGYYSKWFQNYDVTIPANQTEDITVNLGLRMDWIGECVMAFGTLAVGFMAILGIGSLPSVGSSMNWKQWVFVQSYLGYFCLCLAAIHVSFITCPGWNKKPFNETIRGMGFLSVQLPYFTLFLRLLLFLPCLSVPLFKIRQGWERGARNDIEDGKPVSNGIHNSSYDMEMAPNSKL